MVDPLKNPFFQKQKNLFLKKGKKDFLWNQPVSNYYDFLQSYLFLKNEKKKKDKIKQNKKVRTCSFILSMAIISRICYTISLSFFFLLDSPVCKQEWFVKKKKKRTRRTTE